MGQWPLPWFSRSSQARQACSERGAAPGSPDPPTTRQVLKLKLVEPAIGPAASDGARVVARLAPRDRAQLRAAPARDATHLEAVDRRAALVGPRPVLEAPLRPPDRAAQLTGGRRAIVARRGGDEVATPPDAVAVELVLPAPAARLTGHRSPPLPAAPTPASPRCSYQPALCRYQPATGQPPRPRPKPRPPALRTRMPAGSLPCSKVASDGGTA